MPKKIPIILITGFLGSGKTTFINWLLEKHADKKISVVLNEFGNIKLESQFVKQHTEDIIELANGCMCCVAKSDVPRVLLYILEHSPQTEYIIIEASGLSDPDPVREALQTAPVNEHTTLEATICVVDAVNFEQTRNEHAVMMSQIGDADLLVLSKIEEAGTDKTTQIQSQLEHLTPDVRVLQFTKVLSPDIFLSTSFATSRPADETGEHHHVHEDYQMYWYESEQPHDVNKVIQVIRNTPKEIVRIKGVVFSSDSTNSKVLIQRVGSRTTTDSSEWGSDEKKQTTILFIGKSFDEDELKKQLDTTKSTI